MNELFKGIVADDGVYYAILLILVGLVSFGLGTYSVSEVINANSNAVIVQSTSATSTEIKASEKEVVASKNGSKYHYLWCSGARQIKEENKIFFETSSAAESAGYTLAGNCSDM